VNTSSGASRSIKDEDIGMPAAGFIFLAGKKKKKHDTFLREANMK